MMPQSRAGSLEGEIMKIEHGTLVLVADGAQALVFRNEGDAKYPVLETLSHARHDNPASHEQGSDTPGRTHSSTDARRSSYAETDWHQQSEDDFARRAAEILESTASAQPEQGIVVVAAPRTLGALRKHYGRATGPRVMAEIDKDLVGHTTDDIIAVLTAHQSG
jgi:protein required for attachment to host cells